MRYVLFTLSLSLTAAACGGNAPQAPPFKAVAETKSIMDNVMERQADIVWGAAGQIITAEGVQDNDRWMKNVQLMMAQGEKMIAAIDRKDSQAMFDVGSDLYDTCTNCHMHYMPEIKDLYK